MRLSHRFTVPAPVEQTWAAFADLERVVPCFPGAALTSFDGASFAGTCKVKLGPVSLVYGGTGRFVTRDAAAHRFVVEASGKDRRGNGTATATVTAQLAAAPDGTTVEVETDLTVTGRPAQFGRGLIQDVSEKLLTQFVTCLRSTLPAPDPADEDDPSGTPPAQNGESAVLDLGPAVLPVAVRRLAPFGAALALVVLLIRRLRRS